MPLPVFVTDSTPRSIQFCSKTSKAARWGKGLQPRSSAVWLMPHTKQGADKSPGGVTCGGNSTHFFDPLTTAFQADVALGSL